MRHWQTTLHRIEEELTAVVPALLSRDLQEQVVKNP